MVPLAYRHCLNRRLLYVVRNGGELEEVARYIHLGADVNCYSKQGFTPLLCAVNYGRIQLAELLLQEGARVNAISRDELRTTPFVRATRNGDYQLARKFLTEGADVNFQEANGTTALMLAAKTGASKRNVSFVRFILQQGADPTYTDADGLTAEERLTKRIRDLESKIADMKERNVETEGTLVLVSRSQLEAKVGVLKRILLVLQESQV